MKLPLFSLQEIIDNTPIANEINSMHTLFLCHTTKYEYLSSICREKKLIPETCKVINEKAVFFFYGKAKYFPSEDVTNSFGRYPPITFVFDIDSIKSDNKSILLFPFDSGGYEKYKIDNSLSATQFRFNLLNRSLEEVLKRYILILYTNNLNYLQRNLTVSLKGKYASSLQLREIEKIHSQVKSLYSKDIEYGEQALSVEIQIQREIELKPRAVILPDSIYKEQEAQQSLNLEESVDMVLYSSLGNPIADYNTMSSVAESYIKEGLEKSKKY